VPLPAWCASASLYHADAVAVREGAKARAPSQGLSAGSVPLSPAGIGSSLQYSGIGIPHHNRQPA
jgi:hypothetical protein